ncbi:MAG TPA: hypothetical protein VM307_09090 [Egibacteraceae bacterium]|nr:hypothetical protein [Egibacteraceae bacterium]
MRRALRVLLVPLAVLGVMTAPAGADAACTDPETGALVLEQSQQWLHQAETKAGNLAAFGVTSFPSWDDQEPTASVQQGAGGGAAANAAAYLDPTTSEQLGLVAEGTFSGCLDTVLLDLYAFLPTNRTGTSGSLAESPFNGIVNLTVDGEQLVTAQEIEANTVPNPGGLATYHLRFAITDLHAALLDWGLDPAADHTLRLNVAGRYVNTSNAVFVFDTTEVPASLTFNGTVDEHYPAISAY